MDPFHNFMRARALTVSVGQKWQA